jgi:hypothetical protein
MVTLALRRFYDRRETPEKGEPLLRELLAFKRQNPKPKAEVVGEELIFTLASLGSNLLQQHK